MAELCSLTFGYCGVDDDLYILTLAADKCGNSVVGFHHLHDCARNDLLTRKHLSVCMYVCVYACVRVCVYVCMYVCMYACMYACMCVCVYACMYVCIYVCMYVMNVLKTKRKTKYFVEGNDRIGLCVTGLSRRCTPA